MAETERDRNRVPLVPAGLRSALSYHAYEPLVTPSCMERSSFRAVSPIFTRFYDRFGA